MAFGLYPSSRWQPGERVVARARVFVPRDTPEGRQRVLLGLRQARTRGLGGGGFVTADSGVSFVTVGELQVSGDAAAAAYQALEARVGAALAAGRSGEARAALADLRSYDDARGHPVVRRAAEGVGGALFSRAVALRERGEIDTAVAVLRNALDVAPWLGAAETVRRAVAVDLRSLAARAESVGDVDRAFSALGLAIELDPRVPTARRAMERLRPLKTAAYDPGADGDAWRAAAALTRAPSSNALDETLDALVRAGRLEEAVTLCPYSTCGLARSPRGRLALARSHRDLGDLGEAAALLEAGAGSGKPGARPTALLRHDVVALLGRTVPESEVAEARAALPNPVDMPLGPWARLVGWSVESLETGETGLSFYVLRSPELPGGQREVRLEATSAAGTRRVRRIVRVSPAPLAAVEVRARIPSGLYRLALTIEGHGSAELDGVSVVSSGWTFEEGDFTGWHVRGTAFGPAPPRGKVGSQQDVTGWRGMRFANSYHGGDRATGQLSSAPFVIDKRTISFLLGGGRQPGRIGVQLKVGGRVVRQATGDNRERLKRVAWDVSDLAGKTAVVEVIDKATKSWGHVLFDDLQLSDVPAKRWPPPAPSPM